MAISQSPLPNLDFNPVTVESCLVFVRLGNIFLIIALFAATNVHWAVLQSVAWTTMLADNLRCCSFTEAVQCTFDGKHPCCLCKAIAAGKKPQQKAEFPWQSQKINSPPLNKGFAF